MCHILKIFQNEVRGAYFWGIPTTFYFQLRVFWPALYGYASFNNWEINKSARFANVPRSFLMVSTDPECVEV